MATKPFTFSLLFLAVFAPTLNGRVIRKVVRQQTGTSDTGSQMVFDMCDTDGNGSIDIDEFKAFLLATTGQDMPDFAVQYSFNMADQNGDGNLNLQELESMGEAVDETGTPDDAAVAGAAMAMYDQNGDGQVTLQEFLAVMAELVGDDLPANILEMQFHQYDLNGDGVLTSDEIEQLATSDTDTSTYLGTDIGTNSAGNSGIDEVSMAFNAFDADSDGFISAQELVAFMSSMMGVDLPASAVQQVIQGLDQDGDGQLNLDEFTILVNSQTMRSLRNKGTRHIRSQGTKHAGIQGTKHVKSQEQSPVVRQETGTSGTDDIAEDFARHDMNHDGFISRGEVEELHNQMGLDVPEEVLDYEFGIADQNGDGLISFDEYVAHHDLEETSEDIDAGMQMAFDMCDTNMDGLIDYDEFKAFLLATTGQDMPDFAVQYSFNMADQNGDGNLDIQEFGSIGEAVEDETGTAHDEAVAGAALAMYDQNGDGQVTLQEFLAVMAELVGDDLPANILEMQFHQYDLNGDGVLTADEIEQLANPDTDTSTYMGTDMGTDISTHIGNDIFTDVGTGSAGNSGIDEVSMAFNAFDADSDGFISAQELVAFMSSMMGVDLPASAVQQVIQGLDQDGDGQLNLDEFTILVNSQTMRGLRNKGQGTKRAKIQGTRRVKSQGRSPIRSHVSRRVPI